MQLVNSIFCRSKEIFNDFVLTFPDVSYVTFAITNERATGKANRTNLSVLQKINQSSKPERKSNTKNKTHFA